MGHYSIAIDGPSGAGKSTVAKLLARKNKLIYVDTGAMYRSVGLYIARCGIDSRDSKSIVSKLPEIEITLKYENDEQQIYLNGKNVSGEIRTEQASKYASDVSALPEVRAFLLDLQRSMAEKNNVIMDGRDIGTVVLPGADIKIFLTADSMERARRRYVELIEKGEDVTLHSVHQNILQRDSNDSSREAAPLKAADDAIICDTTGVSLEKSMEMLEKIINEKVKNVI